MDKYSAISLKYPVSIPSLTDEERKNVIAAYDSSWISSSGEFITEFESKFANYCGSMFGIATSNGTVAIHLALEALGIGRGDEVIVPDLTFAATINAVLHAGATPVITDIDIDSWCISVESIRKLITDKTKAIIPVHIYGQVCQMDEIMAIAEEHNLYVIEDCAEAHGATFKGKVVGSIGHIGCYSFFANKIITTGEGGMCITNSREIAVKLRILRDHGMSPHKKYFHEEVGYNYRMTNLQAAIGVAQIERIDEIIHKRDQILNWYEHELKDIENFQLQSTRENVKKVNWLVSILLNDVNRETVMNKLKENGVDSRPFFYPLSSMPLYQAYCQKETLITSAIIANKGINLPTYCDLEKEDIQFITGVLKKIISEL